MTKRRNKVLVVFGTRPEAIKLAPVIRQLRARKGSFTCRVCVTAQHREMLDDILHLFRIKPDHELAIMRAQQGLAELTSRALEGLDRVYEKEKPDVVLVQGDTTTTFCGALAAYYRKIKVGHVEAGLRTRNKYAPFPEEINRAIVTRVADYHFAPTEQAKRNLLAEGVAEEDVVVTGNTVVDALLWMRQKVRRRKPALPDALEKVLDGKRLVLVTGHRRESFGKGLEQICLAIRRITEEHHDVCVVYPVHLNPNVQKPVMRILGSSPSIVLLKPQPYDIFVWLMDRAEVILTDSGGVQEEAPSLGKPVLVMREVTERPEGLNAGVAELVGTDPDRICCAVARLLKKAAHGHAKKIKSNPYGDGQAALRVVDALVERFTTNDDNKVSRFSSL